MVIVFGTWWWVFDFSDRGQIVVFGWFFTLALLTLCLYHLCLVFSFAVSIFFASPTTPTCCTLLDGPVLSMVYELKEQIYVLKIGLREVPDKVGCFVGPAVGGAQWVLVGGGVELVFGGAGLGDLGFYQSVVIALGFFYSLFHFLAIFFFAISH